VGRELAPDDLMVVLLPDSGKGYLSKLYNDAWMAEHGFIERPGARSRIGDVLQAKRAAGVHVPDMVVVPAHAKVGQAIDVLQAFGISQLPVAKQDEPAGVEELIGSINERSLLDHVFRDPDAVNRDVAEVMDPPLPVLDVGAGIDEMFAGLSKGAEALVVADGAVPRGVVTRADLLEFLAHNGAGNRRSVY
jgi:cystathionine beta-synthase